MSPKKFSLDFVLSGLSLGLAGVPILSLPEELEQVRDLPHAEIGVYYAATTGTLMYTAASGSTSSTLTR